MKSMYLLLLCFTDSLGCRSKSNRKFPKYFTSGKWGGWSPKDSSWKEWIAKYGRENHSVAFDSTEVGRDTESGWPRFWKGMGKGNAGVPAPPWAFVPENHGRASFCYLLPDPGFPMNYSDEQTGRWGFNPSSNECERFLYNGQGGNENNFLNKYACTQACGRVPDSGCDSGKIDFRDYIETKIHNFIEIEPDYVPSQENYSLAG